jgi:TonB family protein
MTSKTFFFLFALHISLEGYAQDTLFFRLSNPWNTVKEPNGKYIRKAVKEKDYYHVWDYNGKNILVTESYYVDTSFKIKLFCHKYFNEIKGFLEETRCYENGSLNGYAVSYNEKGDTMLCNVFENGALIRSSGREPREVTATIIMRSEPAAFPGGTNAWLAFLGNHLHYPDSLQHIKGEVLVKFIITAKGTIETVEIVKSLDPVLDQEAIRVILKSPKWKPAKQNGKKVQETITQPIHFG